MELAIPNKIKPCIKISGRVPIMVNENLDKLNQGMLDTINIKAQNIAE